jgi:glycosyltransferase involved in cell wall biosynthesis
MTEPLRLAMMIGSLQEGGAERQLVALACALRARGHEVLVLTLRPGDAWGPQLRAAGVETVCLNVPLLRPLGRLSTKPAVFRALRRTVALLRRFGPDVLHAWLFEAEAWALLAHYFGAPGRLVTIRGNIGGDVEASAWKRFVRALANRRAAAVIANARLLARQALANERCLSARRVHVIPNGVDLERFERAEPADWRTVLPNFVRASPVVLCVANLFPYKGHADLLRAWERVHREHPLARLVCVGRDEGIRDQLEQRAREAGIDRCVDFLGARDDVPSLMRSTTAVVLASHEEGLPNVVVEAMVAGCPVVATQVGGTGEAVAAGRTGILVPPHDPFALSLALIRLLGDETLRERMGNRGRSIAVKRFSLERLVSAHELVYRSVVKIR